MFHSDFVPYSQTNPCLFCSPLQIAGAVWRCVDVPTRLDSWARPQAAGRRMNHQFTAISARTLRMARHPAVTDKPWSFLQPAQPQSASTLDKGAGDAGNAAVIGVIQRYNYGMLSS